MPPIKSILYRLGRSGIIPPVLQERVYCKEITNSLMNNRKIIYFLDLIQVLVLKDLKIRYKSSVLGYLWSLLNPLSLALIFYFVFKIVVKFPVENYVVYLVTGLFPWQWIANSLSVSTSVLLANAGLIKKVQCPREVFPLSVVLQDGVHFILSLPVIFLLLKFYALPFLFSRLPLVFLLIFLQLLFLYGLTLIISSINLFFRDLERLVAIFLTIMFYFTPIIYTVDYIPNNIRPYLYFNPFFPFIELWHMVFLKDTINFTLLYLGVFYTGLFLLVGWLVFKKLSPKFAEAL